jgi:hypothetical protein
LISGVKAWRFHAGVSQGGASLSGLNSEDAALAVKIAVAQRQGRGNYGSPRIVAEPDDGDQRSKLTGQYGRSWCLSLRHNNRHSGVGQFPIAD